ncbi:MAG: HEPN domain-containing protein [Alphaproteobacteria bacterium]|nr:HEPN domain-containing protein [Alphaproteobacteria bacterium]
MSGGEPQEHIQWREALLWLAKARADIRGARTLLADNQPELAAFLVQQALEKTLKGLLVAAAQDVRRTHDIEALATLARIHWPDLLPSSFPLAAVGQWYVTTRYPGLDTALPASAEVTEALEAVAAFTAAAQRLSPLDAAERDGSAEHTNR